METVEPNSITHYRFRNISLNFLSHWYYCRRVS